MSELLKWEGLLKFIKFGVVGVSGIAVDFGITYLCKEILKIQKYVSNAIGFTTAASTNYILNRIWTFESTDPAIFLQYSKFLMISLIGLGINTLVLWILVSKYHGRFYVSKLFAVAVVMIWNFLANYFFTFQG
ncbi:MAG: GtrA family protein [Bacteroidales bacterium]|nr:GtrA family protein [Lentimicrobiaceae bacterium]MDD5694611.1 GtrA family protein [Bacteroidales bacterium]